MTKKKRRKRWVYLGCFQLPGDDWYYYGWRRGKRLYLIPKHTYNRT